MQSNLKVTQRMRRELELLLSEKGPQRFRRSEVSDRLYSMTSPRDRKRADDLADLVIKAAHADGLITRTGHQHWVRAGDGRALIGGRIAEELEGTVELSVNTHCPSKWLSVDLQSGQIWIGSKDGWKRAPDSAMKELQAVIDLPV